MFCNIKRVGVCKIKRVPLKPIGDLCRWFPVGVADVAGGIRDGCAGNRDRIADGVQMDSEGDVDGVDEVLYQYSG